MKKILIMGGGINQLPLINAANELGYKTILCDGNNNPIGRQSADMFYHIDISDHTQVEKIAKKEQVEGIVANTESLMVCLAQAQTNCGFIANPPEAVECLQNKTRFRRLQKTINLVSPVSVCTDNWNVALEEIRKMNFPVIMKPTQSSGSRGIQRIDSVSDIKKCDYEFCKELSRNDFVTLEEFITSSDNFLIQGEIFVWKGVIELFILFRTQKSKTNPYISGHHSFPYCIDKDRYEVIKRTLQSIITESNIEYGEYNIESFFTLDNKYFVIEINARQGGSEIPRAIHHSMGIDLHKLMVTTSVGDITYLDELTKKFGNSQIYGRYIMDLILSTNKTGMYLGYDCGKLKNNLIDSCVRAVPNKTILRKNLETNQTEIAYLIFEFDTYNELYSYSDSVWDCINVLVK